MSDETRKAVARRDGWPCEDYRLLWERLRDDLTELHVDWFSYKDLYATSSCRVDLLNKSAGGFFARAQAAALSHVCLSIGRLLDSTSVCGKDNLVLESLIKGLNVPEYEEARCRMESALKKLQEAAKPVVACRHRRFGHRDKMVALGLELLPDIRLEDVDQILALMREFMDCVPLEFGRPQVAWEYAYLPNGVEALVGALRRGVRFNELIGEGKIDKGELVRAIRCGGGPESPPAPADSSPSGPGDQE